MPRSYRPRSYRPKRTTIVLAGFGLLKQPVKHLLVETNDHFFPHDQRGSTEISGRTEHNFEQLFIGGVRFFPINFDDLFPFGRMYPRRRRYQLERLRLLMNVLFRIDGYFGFDPRVSKKLLRFFASRSAFAVIVPVNSLGHYSFLLI